MVLGSSLSVSNISRASLVGVGAGVSACVATGDGCSTAGSGVTTGVSAGVSVPIMGVLLASGVSGAGAAAALGSSESASFVMI